MRIAVISTPIFRITGATISGYGGLEMIAAQCAAGLAARGHDVILVAPDGSECPGVTVVQVGPAGVVDEKRAYGGFPEVKDGEVVVRPTHEGYWQYLLDRDVIIDHSWLKCSYLLKMEGRLKAPILGVLHAPVPTMYQTLPPVEKPCIVCISRDQADHFQALFSREARVCHNGIDMDFYRPMSGVARKNRLLFVARFSEIKGADIAVESCAKAGKDLDVIGDTQITGEPAFYEKCKKMADGTHIKIHGGVSRGETVEWYSRGHAFLHPNERFREPFGLAPVEAMACGLPVVTYDHGAMRETVVHGEVGYLAKTRSEYFDLVKNLPDVFPESARERCRENASRFSVGAMVSRYEELCKEAVDSGGW